MTLESNYWNTVRSNLGPFGVLKRIEDSTDSGTSDVAFCLARHPLATARSGWIEIKVLAELPKRGSTPVVVRKLESEQVEFLERWAAAGGHAWLLLRTAPWHLLLDPPAARRLFERELTANDLLAAATVAESGKFPTGKILRALTCDR